MAKYKLTPSQWEYLENEIKDLGNKMEAVRRFKKEDNDFRATNVSADGASDIIFDANFAAKSKIDEDKLKLFKEIYCNSAVINEHVEGVAGIGSKVSVLFDGEQEVETFTLLDVVLDYKAYSDCASTKSELGKAVLGKSENDTFEYSVNNNKMSGVIKKIVNQLENTNALQNNQKTIGR